MKRKDSGRGLGSFIDVYKETKVRTERCMATYTNEWIATAWQYEYMKEQTSFKKVAEQTVEVNQVVNFEVETIKINEQWYNN